MNRAQFKFLLGKYAEGTSTKQEDKLVENVFTHFQQKEDNLLLATDVKGKLLFKQIQNSIAEANTNKLSKWSTKNWLRIAAVALVLLGTATCLKLLVFTTTYTQVVTANAQRKTLHLPDGSTITLNAGSTLLYANDFAENRKIQLNGEAFFKVAKDAEHPFQIVSDSVTTTVLGTSFNVNAYKGAALKVSVRTGKVQVSTKSTKNTPYILLPNQSVTFGNNGTTQLKKEDEFSGTAGWLQNTIILQETSLKEVAQILEKWYNVKIILDTPAIENLTINAKFKNEDLKIVLESITYLENLRYEYINPETVIIKK